MDQNETLVDRYIAANQAALAANGELMTKIMSVIQDQLPSLIQAVEENRLGDRIAKNTIRILESISDEEMERQRLAQAQIGAIVSAMSLDQFRIAQSEMVMSVVKPMLDRRFGLGELG